LDAQAQENFPPRDAHFKYCSPTSLIFCSQTALLRKLSY